MVKDYDHIQVKGDYQLVIKQITGEYQCLNPNLQRVLKRLEDNYAYVFDTVVIHVFLYENGEANELDQ